MSTHIAATSPQRQRGVALLTAIFVVALATIAATALATSSAIAVRRTENLQGSEVARWYSEGVESWVLSMLKLDAASGKKYDSLADPWAQPVSFIPIDNGGIRGQITDLQGLFNLNSLADTNPKNAARNLQVFQRLLQNLPNIDPSAATGIGEAIKDWVDVDDERTGTGGFEDGDYESLDPAYRAGNQPMQSVSELNAIHGMTPKLFEALRPYVCALPTTQLQINVNTAPAPVLMALSSSTETGRLQSFIEERTKSPAEDLKSLDLPDDAKAVAFVGTSTYFELKAEVIVGSARSTLYSVIKRGSGSDPLVIAHSNDSD